MIHVGDCLDILPTLPERSVHCVVTSPPYFGLRDYGIGAANGEIGCEPTPDAFVAAMVRVFREVKRVLRDDGTCWLNLGDSFAGYHGNKNHEIPTSATNGWTNGTNENLRASTANRNGLKPKDLIGIPWRVAFALQADGWWLRDAIVWAKATVDADGNLEGPAMPGSQRDRCTSAYEMLFQFTKSSRYYFDIDAVKTKSGALPRNVWRLNPKPFKGCHFAVMPPKLVEPCIKAGTSQKGCCPGCGKPWVRMVERLGINAPRGNEPCKVARGMNGNADRGIPGGYCPTVTTTGWRPDCTCHDHDPIPCTVLDPFSGAGTVGLVAKQLGRGFVGCELNPDYAAMAEARIAKGA